MNRYKIRYKDMQQIGITYWCLKKADSFHSAIRLFEKSKLCPDDHENHEIISCVLMDNPSPDDEEEKGCVLGAPGIKEAENDVVRFDLLSEVHALSAICVNGFDNGMETRHTVDALKDACAELFEVTK